MIQILEPNTSLLIMFTIIICFFVILGTPVYMLLAYIYTKLVKKNEKVTIILEILLTLLASIYIFFNLLFTVIEGILPEEDFIIYALMIVSIILSKSVFKLFKNSNIQVLKKLIMPLIIHILVVIILRSNDESFVLLGSILGLITFIASVYPISVYSHFRNYLMSKNKK
ncbi:MAG: hypothetical protein R3Y13_05370 [bacterium]